MGLCEKVILCCTAAFGLACAREPALGFYSNTGLSTLETLGSHVGS